MKEQNLKRAMFDFIALCQKDLGTLYPNWFEELTLSASSNQPKQPRDDARCFTSSYNNDYFKTPWQKQTLYSQLDCTPLIFSGLTSITTSVSTPEKRNNQTRLKRAENGTYSTMIQETRPPYKASEHGTSSPTFDISLMKSPALLHNTCRTPQHTYSIQGDGCSFFTPPVSSEVTSKQIAESLGVEVDPDMSWTSSLATPPSLTPTVIICKAKENDLPQDRSKEVQVPLLLHSNLNAQSNAFAVDLNSACALPVIGEEENEEMEAVDQSCKPGDGPDHLVNDSKSYEDGKLCISKIIWKQTVPDETMSFTESMHLGLRRVKSHTRKRKKNSTVGNFQTNSIKTLLSHSSDAKGSLESIVAESNCNMVSNNLTFSPVKDCNMKPIFLIEKNSVNQNQRADIHLYDKSSEKDLSGHNVSSSSDWSQLNLSELDESQMINECSGLVDSSTNALCLRNGEDLALISNENASNLQLDNTLEEVIDKGSVSWEEMGPIAQSSTSHSLTGEVTKIRFNNCAVTNDFRTVGESTKNSEAEVQSSSPNHTCVTTQLSKLPSPETPYTDYFTIGNSKQIQPLVERCMDSESETVSPRLFPICKNERAQIKKSTNLDSKTNLIKLVTTLKDHTASFTDTANNNNMPNQPAVGSRMLNNGVYSVTDPGTAKSTTLVLNSVKCQVDEEDHSFLLSTLKGRPRKFLYSVQDPSNHQEQKNISVDRTDLQNRTPIFPLVLEPSCKSSAQTFGKRHKSVSGFTTSATYRENEEVASAECASCIDPCEKASEIHDTEANENLQHNHQLPKEPGSVEDEVMPPHPKDDTVDNLSHAANNNKNWDNFVTPLNSRPAPRNSRERRIFATACHTVAKRLTMESKVMLTNSFGVQAEDAKDSCAPSVVNSVQPEQASVIENTVMQNKGRSYFEFSLSPLSDANQSPVHRNCSETKLQGNTIIHGDHDSNYTFVPVSAQLSTKQLACTSIISHTVSSHSSCISNVLHKTKQLFSDLENYKRTLKNKTGLSEPQQIKPNESMEILSTCLNKEKHFEGNLAVDMELSNKDQRLGVHTLVEAKERDCSVNTDFHISNRKIAVLASTLKTRKLIAEAGNDVSLASSKPVLVQSLPECEIECIESAFTGAKEIPCNIPCSTISGLGMTWNKSSKLTEGYMNSHKETRTTLSASITETELDELAEITQPSQCIVPIQEGNTSRMELKSQNGEDEISSVTKIKETCTVLESTKTPLLSGHSESCKRGPNFNDCKTAEKHIDLSAENLSKGKLFKNIDTDSLQVNSTQAVVDEYITSKNRFESQGNSPISSTKAEIKTESPEPKMAMENFKQPPLAFAKTLTFDFSATLSQPELLGKCTCLTANQTVELTELFNILEDTGGQFECTQFRKQSAVGDVTNKDANLLIIERLGHTPPTPILDGWKDIDFGDSFEVEPSMLLNNQPCNSQQLAESSKTETRSEIYQQNTEKIDQTKPNKLADSFVGLSSKKKEIAASTVPNFFSNSMEIISNSVKIQPVTTLKAVPPLKDEVSFKREYGGFCAASGNKIKLSVESLKKAANVFRDIDNNQDQTTAQVHATNALGYLLDSSVSESEKVTEDKLNDVTKTIKSSESHQQHATLDNHLTVNSKNIQDNILKSGLWFESKIVNSDRKISDFQIVGSRRVTICEDTALDKAIPMTADRNVLKKSDRKNNGKPRTMKNTICQKNTWQSDYSGTKDTGNKELDDSKMEPTDDYLLSNTFASHLKPSFGAIDIEDSNEINCFQTASGERVTVSKGNLDKAKSLLDAKGCYSENGQNPKLPTGTMKNASQQLDKSMNIFQSHIKKKDANMELSDHTGSSQTVSNISVCAAVIVPNEENISEHSDSIQNDSLFAATGTGMRGFQTASGKMVPVCKASLDKAKALFAEEDLLSKTIKHSVETFSTVSPCPHTSSPLIQSAIKSAVNKQLENNHSPEMLHLLHPKSHSKLHDFSVQSEHISEHTDVGIGTEMKGFQTASGRRVSVSKVALDKGRALFFEEDYNKFRIQDSLISSANIKNAHSEGNVLNDGDSEEAKLPQKLEMRNQMNSHAAKQPLGFCTANSNIVSVIETNLKYAKEKFSDDEPGQSKISVSFPNTPNVNQSDFAGDVIISESPQQFLKTGPIAFSTASGKSVQVSEESLKKCKHFFTEVGVNKEEFERIMDKDLKSEENRLSEEIRHSDTSSSKASLGFNTASGKAVFVSDNALQKVKNILKEFDMNDCSLSSPKCLKSTFCEKPQKLPLTSICSSSLFYNTMSSEQTCEEESSELVHKSLSNNCSERVFDMKNPIQVESSEKEMNHPENRPTRNLAAPCWDTSILMSGFQTAKGKEVMVEESSLTAARMCLASNENSKLNHTVERVNMHTESRIRPICNVSSISTSVVHALKNNHGTYLKMLENHMENETLEGSKDLMEDNELLDFTSDKAFRSIYDSTNQSIRPELRTGKRVRSEGKSSSEEPLPKRQLLSEFDRTVQSDHKTAFKPLICNPEGALCDRRKFMYSVPLKPVVCGPSKDKSISNSIHQQLISPNVTFPVQENSVQRNLCHHHEVKLLKGQAAVFKPPFQRHSGGYTQQNSDRQSTSKPKKTFVPPFKTLPDSPQMEKQENVKIVHSPMQSEIGTSTKMSNYSKHLQEDGTLKDDPVIVRCLEDKLRSRTDTSEELKADAEGFSRIVQNLCCARDLQEMRLIKKRRQTIHPQPGSLYRTKTSGASRLSLHAAVEGNFPTSFTEEQLYIYGVSRSTLWVRAENAESFQINSREFFSEELFKAGNGMQLADGGWLIPDDNGMAGKSEFYRALLDAPGVDPKLISEAWAYNHYRWLVWKLAAMETAFPKEFGSRCLTPETILLQLKYRYDVEIDQSRRSAMKKIMERDDVAAKTLVVCVSKIISMGTKSFQNNHNPDESKTVTEKSVIETKKDMSLGVIEVTDGWYGIKALLDLPLTTLLQKRRLVVGQKIIVHGAELIGSQDACTPLEAPESLMIKISANSTRPARWYAKLGFHRDPRPFPLRLSALFGEGGMVGCVDVTIVRIYPIQWMEKKSNGMYVFRNERAEEREAQIHYENQQRKLEVLYAKIEAELQEQYRVDKKEKKEHKMQKVNEQQIMMLQDGIELYEAIENSSDPLSVEAYLNEQQLRALNNYRQLLKERKQIQIEAEFRKALEGAQSENSYTKRDVTPVWKLRVVDYKGQDNDAVYMLNIWRPVAELHSLLKEGGRYWIYYLSTSSCKSRLSHVDLQLTATKKTRYQQLQPSPKVLEQLYQPRQAVTYGTLLDTFFRPVCKEVDLAGYVVHILEKPGAPPTVYLADENQDLVAVKVWAGFSQLALEDIVKPGALVVASNLQWTSESYMGIPILFTGDLSSFSANPKEGHLRAKYTQLKNSVENLQSFIKDTEEKVMTVLETVNTPRLSRDFGADSLTPANRTSSFVPVNSTVLTPSSAESKMQTLSPAVESGSRSALCSTKVTSVDSLTNLKKKGLNFLSRIPSPAPLSPLCSSVSPSVQKGFRPPRRCITPQSYEEAIQTGSNKLAQASSLKRTEISKIVEDNWVTDEELAMINTQALREGWANGHSENERKVTKVQIISPKDLTLLPKNVKNDLDIELGAQISKIAEDNWVTDEELAMINTQALLKGWANGSSEKARGKVEKAQIVNTTDLALLPQNASYLDSELGSKVSKIVEDNWVADEELAMINTQALCDGWANGSSENSGGQIEKAQFGSSNDTASLQQNVKNDLDGELETVSASPDKSPPVVSKSKRRRKDETSKVSKCK